MYFDKEFDYWWQRNKLSKDEQERLVKKGEYNSSRKGFSLKEDGGEFSVEDKIEILSTNGGVEFFEITGKASVFVKGRKYGGQNHGREFELEGSVNKDIYDIGWKRLNEFPDYTESKGSSGIFRYMPLG